MSDAVAHVLVQQAKRHPLQGFGGGAHLGENVDAIHIVFNHSLETTNLALNPPEALDVRILVQGVSVHGGA
jgi:hypothetical protein